MPVWGLSDGKQMANKPLTQGGFCQMGIPRIHPARHSRGGGKPLFWTFLKLQSFCMYKEGSDGNVYIWWTCLLLDVRCSFGTRRVSGQWPLLLFLEHMSPAWPRRSDSEETPQVGTGEAPQDGAETGGTPCCNELLVTCLKAALRLMPNLIIWWVGHVLGCIAWKLLSLYLLEGRRSCCDFYWDFPPVNLMLLACSSFSLSFTIILSL